MKKVDLGKLIISNYGNAEIVEYINSVLKIYVHDLAEAITKEKWGEIGAIGEQLSILCTVTDALDEKMNGNKDLPVV